MDYYKILEVPIDAGLETIRAAYRQKAKEYHPDKVESLGDDLRLLAARKMVLINEAYRILVDPESRAEYDQNKESGTDEPFYIVCRKCGHSVAIHENESSAPEKCEICSEPLEFNSKSRSTDKQAGCFWQAMLQFLELSAKKSSGIELPSSVTLISGNYSFTLDSLQGSGFCLFTQYHQIYTRLRKTIGNTAISEWDSAQNIGFISLPGDIRKCIDTLVRMESGLSDSNTRIFFNFGERKNGASEPNIMFISAVEDISLATAAKMWVDSGKNLLAYSWEFPYGWSLRLERMYEIMYGDMRKEKCNKNNLSDFEDVIDFIGSLEKCLHDIELKISQIKTIIGI